MIVIKSKPLFVLVVAPVERKVYILDTKIVILEFSSENIVRSIFYVRLHIDFYASNYLKDMAAVHHSDKFINVIIEFFTLLNVILHTTIAFQKGWKQK